MKCKKTFVWKSKKNKFANEKHWFNLWVKEGYSIRQLSYYSKHSQSKLKRIINYWIKEDPPITNSYGKYKYIELDGTYFHKNGCLICIIDIKSKKIIDTVYVRKENYKNTYPWLKRLSEKGLNPAYVVLDGERSVIQAVKDVWPEVTIQRCLYHIQKEGLRWLRTYPKTQAGKDLRVILGRLCAVKTEEDKNDFLVLFNRWADTYRDFIKKLPSTDIALKDLKRTVRLIQNGLPDMFHYLKDKNMPSTTNLLEGFYSQLKADYLKHRGLTEKKKRQYLKWYCHLKRENGL